MVDNGSFALEQKGVVFRIVAGSMASTESHNVVRRKCATFPSTRRNTDTPRFPGLAW